MNIPVAPPSLQLQGLNGWSEMESTNTEEKMHRGIHVASNDDLNTSPFQKKPSRRKHLEEMKTSEKGDRQGKR